MLAALQPRGEGFRAEAAASEALTALPETQGATAADIAVQLAIAAYSLPNNDREEGKGRDARARGSEREAGAARGLRKRGLRKRGN